MLHIAHCPSLITHRLSVKLGLGQSQICLYGPVSKKLQSYIVTWPLICTNGLIPSHNHPLNNHVVQPLSLELDITNNLASLLHLGYLNGLF